MCRDPESIGCILSKNFSSNSHREERCVIVSFARLPVTSRSVLAAKIPRLSSLSSTVQRKFIVNFVKYNFNFVRVCIHTDVLYP